jgi:hypothetical protein
VADDLNDRRERNEAMKALSDAELRRIVHSGEGGSTSRVEAARAELAFRNLASQLDGEGVGHLNGTGSSAGGDPREGTKVEFEVFRSTISSWQDLFASAAAFATKVGPERVISISHSADNGEGVVTVWYWS